VGAEGSFCVARSGGGLDHDKGVGGGFFCAWPECSIIRLSLRYRVNIVDIEPI
jgi:hypothetical protein